MSDELPEGWALVNFRDIAVINGGVTKGQKRRATDTLRKVPYLRVEALFRLADAIERRLAAATARVEKLTQAILARAFRGELVPTEAELARREGREYEPAAALLERIRTERAGAPPSPLRPARRRKLRKS